jgi:hypothetical protein
MQKNIKNNITLNIAEQTKYGQMKRWSGDQ